ncbi:hypothetical protein MTO96_047152 [Rhipicephalus appendiculatus]
MSGDVPFVDKLLGITTPATPKVVKPPSAQKPDMFPLLCTFNILQFKAQSVLPDDGTCDMIFLDSLYRNDKNVLSQSPAGVVEQFLIVANDSRQKNLKTKMGLAFDSHSAGYRKMTSGSDWTVILKVMWAKYKCSYYGALDGNIRAFDSPDKVEALWKPLSVSLMSFTYFSVLGLIKVTINIVFATMSSTT